MTELIRAIRDRNPGVPASPLRPQAARGAQKAGARDAPRSRRSIFSLTLGEYIQVNVNTASVQSNLPESVRNIPSWLFFLRLSESGNFSTPSGD